MRAMRDSNHKVKIIVETLKLSLTDPTAVNLILLIFEISNNKIRKGIELFNTKIRFLLLP